MCYFSLAEALSFPCCFLDHIMSRTAGMMSAMPMMTCQVNASLNMRHPTMTAVNGSSAPRTATIVLPIRFTLYTRATLVTKVQMSESESKLLI